MKNYLEGTHIAGSSDEAHIAELHYQFAVRGRADGAVENIAKGIDVQIVPESCNEVVGRRFGWYGCRCRRERTGSAARKLTGQL